MRKLIVSMNLTLDGYLSGPDGELDWHIACWTKQMGDALYSQLAATDTILLGRVTYTAMAAHCLSIVNGPSCRDDDFAFANMMNSNTKIVFSKTMKLPQWSNTQFLRGDVKDEIMKLKKKKGKDILVYGSSQLVTDLIAAGHVNEYRLWVHPVVSGKGISFFTKLQGTCHLKLLKTKTFNSGVVLLQYKPLQ
jgi:dihydrofolate reductase